MIQYLTAEMDSAQPQSNSTPSGLLSTYLNKKIIILVIAVAVLIAVLISSKVVTINTKSYATNKVLDTEEEDNLENYINDYMVKQDRELNKKSKGDLSENR